MYTYLPSASGTASACSVFFWPLVFVPPRSKQVHIQPWSLHVPSLDFAEFSLCICTYVCTVLDTRYKYIPAEGRRIRVMNSFPGVYHRTYIDIHRSAHDCTRGKGKHAVSSFARILPNTSHYTHTTRLEPHPDTESLPQRG